MPSLYQHNHTEHNPSLSTLRQSSSAGELMLRQCVRAASGSPGSPIPASRPRLFSDPRRRSNMIYKANKVGPPTLVRRASGGSEEMLQDWDGHWHAVRDDNEGSRRFSSPGLDHPAGYCEDYSFSPYPILAPMAYATSATPTRFIGPCGTPPHMYSPLPPPMYVSTPPAILPVYHMYPPMQPHYMHIVPARHVVHRPQPPPFPPAPPSSHPPPHGDVPF